MLSTGKFPPAIVHVTSTFGTRLTQGHLLAYNLQYNAISSAAISPRTTASEAGDLPIAKAEFMSTAEKGTKGKERKDPSESLARRFVSGGWGIFFHTPLLINSNLVLKIKKLKPRHKISKWFILKLDLDIGIKVGVIY